VTLALDALGAIGHATSSGAIVPFLHHRDPALRRTAVRALCRTGGVEAIAALRSTLSDSDPAVRSFSAASLGTLRAKEATADLFEALDRGIFDAANAIGRICSVDQCQRFATRIEKLPLSVYTSGIEPMLFRPGSEIPEETKAHLVQKLRDLGTIEVHSYLRDLLSRWPKEGSVRVRQAMMAAVSATIGAER
jgi:HEAT repeat protein